MFKRWLGRERHANRTIVDALYSQIVAAARQELPYAQWGVPDTPLGRFEMLSLHMFLVQHRLHEDAELPRQLGQDLIDDFFVELDHSLRELGIGDLGVPKRIKKLARMFYGRTAAYGAAIDAADREALAAALLRNIRPDVATWPEAGALADYVLEAARALKAQPSAEIAAGRLTFPRAGENAR